MEDADFADSDVTPHRQSYTSFPDYDGGGDFWEEIETKLHSHLIGSEGHIDIPLSSGRLTDNHNL
jgi:hypothetical protein